LVWAKSIPKYADMQFGMPQYVKVSKAIERFAPDVVHIVTEGPLGLTALYAAQAHQIPVSSGFHSTFHDFSRFFDLALLVKPIESYLRWFHNHTVLTCVPSQTTLNQLQAFGVTCPLVEVGRGSIQLASIQSIAQNNCVSVGKQMQILRCCYMWDVYLQKKKSMCSFKVI
jgi:hypothetical protein